MRFPAPRDGQPSLLGEWVPLALKIFLVSIAIFGGVGEITIIALFYTNELSLGALGVSALCLGAPLLLNRRGVLENAPYVLVGIVMWVAVLKSGGPRDTRRYVSSVIYSTAGSGEGTVPLHDLEHDLQTAVVFDQPLFNLGCPDSLAQHAR